MVIVQNQPFFDFFFFLLIQANKMCFIIFQNVKTPFLAKKKRSSQNQKFQIFSNGLVRGLGPKLAIFPAFFCCQYRPAKRALSYSRTKKRLSWLKNQEVQKVKKWSFFQRRCYSMDFVQDCPFFQFFLFANIGQQNVFYHILERRNAFLG